MVVLVCGHKLRHFATAQRDGTEIGANRASRLANVKTAVHVTRPLPGHTVNVKTASLGIIVRK